MNGDEIRAAVQECIAAQPERPSGWHCNGRHGTPLLLDGDGVWWGTWSTCSTSDALCVGAGGRLLRADRAEHFGKGDQRPYALFRLAAGHLLITVTRDVEVRVVDSLAPHPLTRVLVKGTWDEVEQALPYLHDARAACRYRWKLYDPELRRGARPIY